MLNSKKRNIPNPIGMSAYSILRQPNMRVREKISCAHEGMLLIWRMCFLLISINQYNPHSCSCMEYRDINK